MQIYQRNRLFALMIIFMITSSFAIWTSYSRQGSTAYKKENQEVALSDTKEFREVIIQKPDKQTLKIVKNPINEQWVLNGQYKVREQLIGYLKFGLQKLEVKRPLPKSEERAVSNQMNSGAIFCRIISGGSEKSFYIMTNPNDLNSSYYQQKKNDPVYIVYVPGVKGNLSNLLNLNLNDWRSRDIFSSRPESLIDLKVVYKARRDDGFEIIGKGGSFMLNDLENLDTVKLRKYISIFNYLNADRFESRDSIGESYLDKEPDVTISVIDADSSKSNFLKIYFLKDSNKMVGLTDKEKDVLVLNPQVFKFVLVNKGYFIQKKSTGL